MLGNGMRPDKTYPIRRTAIFVGRNYPQIGSGKSKALRRPRLSLSPKAKEIIAAGINKFDDEFLFPQNDIDGEPPTKSVDYRCRKTIAEPAFIFRPDDCRDTFATRARKDEIRASVIARPGKAA
jgi:hypothetical protein